MDESFPAAAAPNRMLEMSFGRFWKPSATLSISCFVEADAAPPSVKALFSAFSAAICLESMASSSVKPPWFLDLMGAFLGESSSSENCGSLLAVPGALAIMSTRCFLAALLLLLVPTSWKALSGS